MIVARTVFVRWACQGCGRVEETDEVSMPAGWGEVRMSLYPSNDTVFTKSQACDGCIDLVRSMFGYSPMRKTAQR